MQRALEVVQTARESGHEDFDITEVELLALLGKTDEALTLLDAGTPNDWLSLWHFMMTTRNLAPLHDDPRFDAVFERIRQRMHELRDDLEEEYRRPPAVETVAFDAKKQR